MEDQELGLKYKISLRSEHDLLKIQYKILFIYPYYENLPNQNSLVFLEFSAEEIISEQEQKDLFAIGLAQTPLTSLKYQQCQDSQNQLFNPYLQKFLMAYKELVDLQLQSISSKIFGPLGNFIKDNHKLRSIEFSQYDFDLESIETDIGDFWSSLGSLINLDSLKIYVYSNNFSNLFSSNDCMMTINKLVNLKSFQFENCNASSINNRGIQYFGTCLQTLVSLQELKCTITCRFCTESISQFKIGLMSLVSLKSLDLTIDRLKSEENILELFEGISHLKMLEKLSIDAQLETSRNDLSQNNIDQYLNHLGKLRTMKLSCYSQSRSCFHGGRVDIRDPWLSKGGISGIFLPVPNPLLSVPAIHPPSFHGIKFSESMQNLSNLEELSVGFQKNQTVKKEIFDSVFYLQYLTNLRKLDILFSYTSLRDEKILTQFNQSFSKLVNLDSLQLLLNYIEMSQEDLLQLNKAISQCSQLKTLHYSMIKMNKIQHLGYQSIGNILKTCQNIQNLYFEFNMCNIDEESFSMIRQGYLSLTKLTKFDLFIFANNLITNKIIQEACESIEQLTKIISLSLDISGTNMNDFFGNQSLFLDQIKPITRNKSIGNISLSVNGSKAPNYLKRKMIKIVNVY